MYSVGVLLLREKKRREGTRRKERNKKRERCLAELLWKKIRKDSMELAGKYQIGRQTNPVINVGVSLLKVIFISLEKINRSVMGLHRAIVLNECRKLLINYTFADVDAQQ